MIIINLVAVTAGTWLTEKILNQFRANEWYALVFGLNIGMLMALRLDLTEPVAFLFFQLGAWWFFREKWMSSACAFALAVLGKEVTLILIAGYGLALLLRGPVRSPTARKRRDSEHAVHRRLPRARAQRERSREASGWLLAHAGPFCFRR